MGYTTTFRGRFALDRPLEIWHRIYLEHFASTRRMRRDPSVLRHLDDPLREAVGLPIGPQGGYFIGDFESLSAQHDGHLPSRLGDIAPDSILDPNEPPIGQPGLWCGWTPSVDGRGIEWDGVEKFYAFDAWLEYLIEHFLGRWGYRLDGAVRWQGEHVDDRGELRVAGNRIVAVEAEIR